MSKRVGAKHHTKKFFIKRRFDKKLYLETNLKGFLCSCNNREKDCVKESYNLLNEYADKLYPAAAAQPQETAGEEIEDSLSKEIAQLKEESPKQKRFQVVESGAKNFLFIRTTLENPVELASTIVKDIHETKNQKTKFLLRLVPVETTCKANVEDIGKAFEQLAEKHFKSEALTFSVIFNHRNNNVVSRDEIIKLIADKVFEARPDHKVDLKEAKVSIIVEVIKGFAFLSVIPDYLKYKKYNLLVVCNQEQANAETSCD